MYGRSIQDIAPEGNEDEPMRMKRPAFQFYPADWRKDAALQSCSLEAQGLWINMLCLAHECEPYGHLVVNGRPMTAAQIGRLVGISPRNAGKLLAELLAAGVPSRAENGAFFSRRMVADEDLRARRAAGGVIGGKHGAKGAEHGAKGGRPARQEPPSDPPPRGGARGVSEPPLKPPPSSSSSSSASAGALASATRAREETPLATAPTPAGAVCLAMRRAGLAATNPGDPRLLALVEQGATVEEFAGIAEEAVRGSKGFAWVLATLQARRGEAAAIRLVPKPAVDPMAWAETRSGVINRANNLGIGPWDEVEAYNGVGPTWSQYKRQVLEADAAARQEPQRRAG